MRLCGVLWCGCCCGIIEDDDDEHRPLLTPINGANGKLKQQPPQPPPFDCRPLAPLPPPQQQLQHNAEDHQPSDPAATHNDHPPHHAPPTPETHALGSPAARLTISVQAPPHPSQPSPRTQRVNSLARLQHFLSDDDEDEDDESSDEDYVAPLLTKKGKQQKHNNDRLSLPLSQKEALSPSGSPAMRGKHGASAPNIQALPNQPLSPSPEEPSDMPIMRSEMKHEHIEPEEEFHSYADVCMEAEREMAEEMKRMEEVLKRGGSAPILAGGVARPPACGFFAANNKSFTPLPWKLQDYKVVRLLGHGSFAVVKMVEAPDKQRYAMKIISKSDISRLGRLEHILNEKDAMERLDTRFAIRFFGSFINEKYIFFIEELCQGGDLYKLLKKLGQITEREAQFYAGSIVLALEHFHRRKVAFRDLKPENLLLTTDGYMKFVDFGFAKILDDGQRTYTMCGTPDYFAPEIILGQGHTKSVDWWALGVLIYELVAGYPPFVDETVKNTYARIVKGVVEYPRSFSPCLVDLLSRLLEMMPDKRLGATLEGADAIKSHPWFAGFDWCSLESGQMQPPILPNLDDQPDPVDVRKFSSFTCSLVEHRGLTAAGDENDQDSYRGHPWSSAVQFHQQMRKYSVPVHHGSWAQCSGS